jgi:hypothetical protein
MKIAKTDQQQQQMEYYLQIILRQSGSRYGAEKTNRILF